MAQNPENQRQPKQIPPIYLAQTALKAAFIVMAIPNLSYTILVGVLASVCGIIRMLKTPQLNKQYLQKLLMNPHGQNLVYLGMGVMGSTNFLYFAPLVLYFFYALAQFYNQLYPASGTKIGSYVVQIRNNKWFFMESKSKLQILYFVYLLITIPIDFSRIIKCLIIGQYNLLRYRVSQETRYAATNINVWIEGKIRAIGPLHKLYTKLISYVYNFANQNPGQNNAGAQ